MRGKRSGSIWLPLSSQAVALLKTTPAPEDGGRDGVAVRIPLQGKTARIMDAGSAMETVSVIVGKHLLLHDLRRSFTNYAMRECRIATLWPDMLTRIYNKASAKKVRRIGAVRREHITRLES